MDGKEFKKIIVEEFKSEGLEITEEAACRLAKMSFRISEKVIKATDTKIDDIVLLPLIKLAEKPLFKLIDKIDGVTTDAIAE